MIQFANDEVNLEVLKKRAFNYRWAEVAEGVIPLTAADSDFPVAPEIREDLIDYINGGYFSYTPKLGFPEFREDISRALYQRKGEKADPSLILPIDSAARGMHIIAQTVLKPGDEALVFDPVDYLFKQSVLSAGATPVLFPSIMKDGYMDLSKIEEYITPRTKMICLCNPHNPLGKLYTREDLELLLDLADQHDLWIMNDEIWADIVFPGKAFHSIVTVGENRNQRVLSVMGFSKSFGLAGLRAGAIYCHDKEIFDKLVEKSDVMTTAGGITSLSQIAGMACLNKCYYWVDAFIKHLTANRDYAIERLNSFKNISCHNPDATFVLFPDISATGLTSEQFADHMMNEVKLAIVPGTDKFFGPGAEGHVRICFSTSFEILKEGLDRFEEGLSRL